MKKRAILSMILVLLFIFTACTSTQPTAPSQDSTDKNVEPTKEPVVEPSVEPVTIRTSVWGGEARFKLYDQVFDLYESENPHVTILRDYLAWGDYWVKKATQAAGGNLPDMTNVSWYSIREYAEKGMYVPLDQYIESGDINIDGWNDLVLDTGKVDGVLYSLPIGVSIDGLMSNKTLIEKAGMEVPPYEITYEDYKDYLLELQGKLPDEVWATTDKGKDFKSLSTWVRQKYGVEFYSPDGNSLGYTKEALKEWLEYWADLRDAGAIVPVAVSQELAGGDPWADTVEAREWVCTWMAPDNQLSIFQLYTKGELTIGRTPIMSDEGVNKYGEILLMTGFSLASNSKVPDETIKLINWFPRNIEGNRIFNADQGFVGVPEVVDMLTEMAEPKKAEFFNHATKVSISQPPVPPTIPWAVGSQAVVSAYERQYDELLYGKKTIDQVVDDFFAEAEELLR